MADTKREIERKYEGPPAGEDVRLPDLTGVSGVSGVLDKGVAELDATYYDTPDQRLAAASLTLRRRTGGADAGWHLKLPVSEGVRDEIRAPLSDTVPEDLTALVRSRIRRFGQRFFFSGPTTRRRESSKPSFSAITSRSTALP